jgi:1-acyl-sn-glycerol-3-phosphate acyltransferase
MGGVERLARLAMSSVSVALEPLSGASPRARATALSRIAGRVLAESGLSIESSGALPSGPCVLVSNHLSWFDPLVVASRVPVTAIAKSEVGSWPFVGARARALGVIFVDRSSAHSGAVSLFKARRALEHGLCVLNFPEGTTTRGDRVLPFRRAIFGLARLMRVPVVPVCLEVDPALTWVGDDPLLPHVWRVASSVRPVVRLRFEAPLVAGEGPDEELAEEARQRIARRGVTQEAPNDAALCA